MVKKVATPMLATLFGLLSFHAAAGEWDQVLSDVSPSFYSHGYSGVLTSDNHAANRDPQEGHEWWFVDSGYRIPLGGDWHFFVEAGSALNVGNEPSNYHLGSGVRYQVLPSLALGSQLRQQYQDRPQTGLQFNGQYDLMPSLALRADLLLDKQSTLSVGIGYQF